jgi:DNA-binding NtrC family response regulator
MEQRKTSLTRSSDSIKRGEHTAMALVLCTGADPEVMKARERLLERAGHKVVMATNERELSAACRQHRFDVAIIGQTLKPMMKQHVVDLVRQHCPNTKILELYPITDSRTIEDADSWIAVPDNVPPELPDRVAELAAQAIH